MLLIGAKQRWSVMQFEVDGGGRGHSASRTEDVKRQLSRRRLPRQQGFVKCGGDLITAGDTMQEVTEIRTKEVVKENWNIGFHYRFILTLVFFFVSSERYFESKISGF